MQVCSTVVRKFNCVHVFVTKIFKLYYHANLGASISVAYPLWSVDHEHHSIAEPVGSRHLIREVDVTRSVVDVHQERFGLWVGQNEGNGRGLDAHTPLETIELISRWWWIHEHSVGLYTTSPKRKEQLSIPLPAQANLIPAIGRATHKYM